MTSLCRRFGCFWIALALLASSTPAQRLPQKRVAPLVVNGIRYSAQGDGRYGYVIAMDADTKVFLWDVRVFHSWTTRFWSEKSKQRVFITDLKLTNGHLLVEDENWRCYSIELVKKHVKKFPCGRAFAS
jgi:hypothetical protein